MKRFWQGLALFCLAVIGAVTSHVHHNPPTGRRLAKDRAAVEAAARSLTYDEIAAAWTATKLDDGASLNAIRARVGVRPLAAHEAAGGIVLVFASHDASRTICLDLIAYQQGNTVRTRPC
jgi:hypothetical protein